MEIDEANEMIFRAALKRLGPEARLDPVMLREQIAEVIRQEGDSKLLAAFTAQLGEDLPAYSIV